MAGAERLAPYLALIDVTQSMCGLIGAGHLEQLQPLQQRAQELWATVPAMPPADAEPLLRRLQQLTTELERALHDAQAQIGIELGSVDRSRVAGRAYAPGAAASTSRIDTAA